MPSVSISKEFLEFMKSESLGFNIIYKGFRFTKVNDNLVEVSGSDIATFTVKV